MRAAMTVMALGLVGCGRLSFKPAPDATDDATDDAAADAPDGLGEAPPTPVAICKVDRLRAASTSPSVDLAVTATDEGYAVAWLDTRGIEAAQAVRLGADRRRIEALELPQVTGTRLGGLSDVGSVVLLASATGALETIFALSPDLTSVMSKVMRPDQIMGHEPFASDTARSRNAVLTASGRTLEAAFVSPSGSIGQPFPFGTDQPIIDLACAYGPGHAHCAWATAGTGPCTAADLVLEMPTTPRISFDAKIGSGCRNVRVVSGPAAADSLLVVWTTDAGSIETAYAIQDGGFDRTIAPVGSAPKVQFDGVRFWIAWLDGAGELMLTSLDLTGTAVDHSLARWVPRGPEAFELIHAYDQTSLAMLRDGELDVLTTCPPSG